MNDTNDREPCLRFGHVIYDLTACQLIDQEGLPIALRDKSLRVLGKLAAHNEVTIGKDELIHAAWPGKFVSDDSLVQCIKDIRFALEDSGRQYLRTAIGRGYSLHGVSEIPVEPGELPKLYISMLRATAHSPELAEIAEVITEELIIGLSPRSGLIVTSDEEQRKDVDYAIDGRVSQSGEHLRVFVQLIRGKSGDVAFAETWNSLMSEAEDLPRQIAERVDNVLRVHMFNFAGEKHIDRKNDELNTQELLAKAAYHMSRIQMHNRDVARDAMTVAIEREPENAIALAMRASTSVISVLQEGPKKVPDPPEYVIELANRAVGIASHIDFVMLTRGCVRMWLNADHDGARADFNRALEISPAFHLAHQFLATSEILSGEHERGIQRVKKFIDLSPATNPRYPHYLTLLALGQILAGYESAAVQTSRESHDRAPNDHWCKFVYATAAASSPKITTTQDFKRMIVSTDLPFTHFRDLPFTNSRDVEVLEERLALAGYPATS
ncbi:winged helix-turn-helix domain-containing tetratricopeptide repeat protein [Marinovum sp.]|uniref:winged helix-turn-helix domain-containing tetratricopeptide repeat protein n=1 Tax=Marinovum sp. TaxID=2024839 RepID=UPI002B269EFB|nr:winged helix-turn-helix domain-containing protein [Marinovum sp.]